MSQSKSFRHDDGFNYLIAVFNDVLKDEFIIGHVMGHLLPVETEIYESKNDHGKFEGLGRQVKLGKKKGQAIQLLLTSNRLLLAKHVGNSWGGSAERTIESVESFWLNQELHVFPKLERVRLERGPLLGSSARLLLSVRDGNQGFTRLVGAIVDDSWLPGLLAEIL
jgi:hypothetical protein